MLNVLLADAAADGSQAITDGIAAHNWILIAAGAVVVGVPLVLKLLGKDVPGLDPVLELILAGAKKLTAPKAIDQAKKDAEVTKIAEAVKAASETAPVKLVPPPGDQK